MDTSRPLTVAVGFTAVQMLSYDEHEQIISLVGWLNLVCIYQLNTARVGVLRCPESDKGIFRLQRKQESLVNAKVNARQHCVSLSCLYDHFLV